MSISDSFAIADIPGSDTDEIDSLPSTSTESFTSEDDYDAQREWEQSLEQLQLLLTMILVPFAGKYLGRKFAYWSTILNYSPEASSILTGLNRLGKIYGMDAQCRDHMDEQKDL
ncbi:hypothetical protein F4677DRAFT_404163 [Hypoxylon crocopeplum]|nr:hypothetical protein F4677DRAFT_404163 [Hypoxylon crocopeplum]